VMASVYFVCYRNPESIVVMVFSVKCVESFVLLQGVVAMNPEKDRSE
jgi:hypothetical protein